MSDPAFVDGLRQALESGAAIYAQSLQYIEAGQEDPQLLEQLRGVGMNVGVPLMYYARTLETHPAVIDTYIREVLMMVLQPLASSCVLLLSAQSVAHARSLPLAPLHDISAYLDNEPLAPWLGRSTPLG